MVIRLSWLFYKLTVLYVMPLTAKVQRKVWNTTTLCVRYKNSSDVHKRHRDRWNRNLCLFPARYVNIRVCVFVSADKGRLHVCQDSKHSTIVFTFSLRIIWLIAIVTELWWQFCEWDTTGYVARNPFSHRNLVISSLGVCVCVCIQQLSLLSGVSTQWTIKNVTFYFWL